MKTLQEAVNYWVENHPEISKLRAERDLIEGGWCPGSEDLQKDPKAFLTRWFQYKNALRDIDLATENTKKKLRDQLDSVMEEAKADV